MGRLIEFPGGNEKRGQKGDFGNVQEQPPKKGKILKFSRGDRGSCINEALAKPEVGQRLFNPKHSKVAKLSQGIEGYCLGMEKTGKKFSLDWRKLLKLNKVLQSLMLQESTSSVAKKQSAYEKELTKMTDDDLITLLNEASEETWNTHPVYWFLVYKKIINGKLFIKLC